MKDGRSVLLLLLSIGLLSTWFYHLYEKNQYSNKIRKEFVTDTAKIVEAMKDSLQKMYASGVNEMGDTIDPYSRMPDSIANEPDTSLTEIMQLRNDISRILSDENIDKKQLRLAEIKMRGLHGRIDRILIASGTSGDNRKRLTNELDELTRDLKKVQRNRPFPDAQQRIAGTTFDSGSPLYTSNLRLAFAGDDDSAGSETEDSAANDTHKMIVSFTAEYSDPLTPHTDVFVVITDPEGATLTDEKWDSGIFNTAKEKDKPFTRKIKVDYNNGERKRLILSFSYDRFIKGTYTVRLYHHGMMIGKISKTLS